MKRLHRPDLYGWSHFDEVRNIDFHSVLWVRSDGNVAIDPLPLSEHDRQQMDSLGGVAHIVITNSDHVRDAARLKQQTGARLYGPEAERGHFPLACDEWLADGAEPIPGLEVLALGGSKTPGELALVLEQTTLVVGDLVRSHAGGALHLLPDAKLSDRAAAVREVQRLFERPIVAVLTGDGWPVFRDAKGALGELLARLEAGGQ